MHLKDLNLVNFKNYEQAQMEFSPKLNCFTGNNGVGKTNLLDAVYYLSMTKSFFNPIDTQNIRHEKDFFVIQGNYSLNESDEQIYCGVQKGKKKQFKRNKKDYERLADHIGLLPVVMVSPADSSLIVEGSDERRRFINGVISQYDKEYLHDNINYNKILVQRNTLLKEHDKRGKLDLQQLEVYDMQLVEFGQGIYLKRKEFTRELIPIFQRYYSTISGEKEPVELEYQSQLSEGGFTDLLRSNRDKDRILMYTTVGPHKDDLKLTISGYPIKKSGSQGQQKTYLVALKMAKFDFIASTAGKKPLLLLDDIFDKFDAFRVRQIVELVGEDNFGQIFITDTSQDRMKSIIKETSIENRIFRIGENGDIKKE